MIEFDCPHCGKYIKIVPQTRTAVLPGIKIGANTIIGAGSVVTRDIPSNVVAYGNPCKVRRKLKKNS